VDLLEQYTKVIPEHSNAERLLSSLTPQDAVFEAVLNWSFNSPQLKRIRVLSEMVAAYNKRRHELTATTDRYLGLVDGFLKDSGKHVRFDERGYISVEIDGVSGEKPIASL
jgi:hypothetical protein